MRRHQLLRGREVKELVANDLYPHYKFNAQNNLATFTLQTFTECLGGLKIKRENGKRNSTQRKTVKPHNIMYEIHVGEKVCGQSGHGFGTRLAARACWSK